MSNQEQIKHQKPTSVMRMEFISNMANTINNSGLPPFVMEPIVKDMLLEIQAATKKQYEYDKEQYEQALASVQQTRGSEQ